MTAAQLPVAADERAPSLRSVARSQQNRITLSDMRLSHPMWQPESLGDVIAERQCDLLQRGKRSGRVTVRVGKPVRVTKPHPGEPWWCPVSIVGAGTKEFRPIAGLDSMQALILALQYITERMTTIADRVGATASWLGETERVILARQSLSVAAESTIYALVGRLKQASAVLDSKTSASKRDRKRASEALRAIAHGTPAPKQAAKRRPARSALARKK